MNRRKVAIRIVKPVKKGKKPDSDLTALVTFQQAFQSSEILKIDPRQPPWKDELGKGKKGLARLGVRRQPPWKD